MRLKHVKPRQDACGTDLREHFADILVTARIVFGIWVVIAEIRPSASRRELVIVDEHQPKTALLCKGDMVIDSRRTKRVGPANRRINERRTA